MKSRQMKMIAPALACALVIAVRLNPSASAASAVTASTLDGGGLHASSANYAVDNSIGGIDGISTGSADTAKNGYIGQLYEVASMTVTATPDSVSISSTAQLSGLATLDDGSALALAGSNVLWSSPTIPYPILSINGSGLLSPASVYANTPGIVDGYYLGATNNTGLLVSTPDTVRDGIPDWWRAAYFGGSGTSSNPESCATCDPDGTGQDNLFKFVAGLNPTNPASVFVLTIAPVSGQPGQKNLIYSPIMEGPAADQIYTVQYRTNLVSGAYATVPSVSSLATNDAQVTATDTNATQVGEFYRVQITLPGDP